MIMKANINNLLKKKKKKKRNHHKSSTGSKKIAIKNETDYHFQLK